jgi:hypothetical protein
LTPHQSYHILAPSLINLSIIFSNLEKLNVPEGGQVVLAPSPLELFGRNEFLPTDLVEVRPAQRQEVLRYLETLKIIDFLNSKIT